MRVAFFVEGDADKAFVEAFVPRIVGDDVGIQVVRVGGKAALPSMYADAAALISGGYEHVFALIDADTNVESEIRQLRDRVEETYRRYGLDDVAHVCLVVPMLEAWLLAQHVDVPESSPQPKRALERAIGPVMARDVARLARELDVEVARRRSPSLNRFVTELEAVAKSRPPTSRTRPRSQKGAAATR
jgi:hypothetical protein